MTPRSSLSIPRRRPCYPPADPRVLLQIRFEPVTSSVSATGGSAYCPASWLISRAVGVHQSPPRFGPAYGGRGTSALYGPQTLTGYSDCLAWDTARPGRRRRSQRTLRPPCTAQADPRGSVGAGIGAGPSAAARPRRLAASRRRPVVARGSVGSW